MVEARGQEGGYAEDRRDEGAVGAGVARREAPRRQPGHKQVRAAGGSLMVEARGQEGGYAED
jgi:hypothetical protein